MAQFNALKNLCNEFEGDLKISNELFVAEVNERFEDIFAVKLKSLTFFNAKLKLLQANPLSKGLPEQDRDETTILREYEDAVQNKIIEQSLVKNITQVYAVKSLLMTPNSRLEPHFVQKKQKIIKSLADFEKREEALAELERVQIEREDELAAVRERHHEALGELKDLKSSADGDEEVDISGPLYARLATLCDKIAMMRWLINHFVIPRTQEYDWLRDHRGALNAIKMARKVYDIKYFMQLQ